MTRFLQPQLEAAATIAPTWSMVGNVLAGTDFIHEADCRLEFSVDSIPSTGVMRIVFRMNGVYADGNYWKMLVNATGRIYLYEYVGGGLTSRGIYDVLAGGEAIQITCEDEEIIIYVNGSPVITHSSAANWKTETAGRVNTLGGGSAISDLYVWPL